MRIGVISDTHNFLDPCVAKLFTGVDHILHGGDIGLPRILLDLEQLAPVTAVIGNTDDPAFGYRLTEVVEVGGCRFLLHHIVNPHEPGKELERQFEQHRPDVVVFGHTHKPFWERVGGLHFLNPGYAGKPRFNMPRSVAILEYHNREFRLQTLWL